MRKLQLLFAALLLLGASTVFSQTLMDYVAEVRGDTLVIKDYWDMNQEQNSLTNAINLDVNNVPAGRVYMLKTNGYYPLVNNPTTLRPTVIVGQDKTILVNNKAVGVNPPVICGAAWEGGSNTGGINNNHALTVKNCSIIPADSKQDLGWNFFGNGADGVKLTLENDLFERTRWVFMGGFAKWTSFFVKDCYFVNMNGQPCRRNGGVMDVFNPVDTLLVENSTHVMAQGMMYKFRANPFNRIILNHNTFVNISNVVMLDLGSQCAISVTNNIFVNCNVQPYGGKTIDVGEEDPGKQPLGLINVYPDTAVHQDRKYLVDNNVIYWDPKLADIPATLNAKKVNGSTNWVSQMIPMNTRTKTMFDDNTTYPYLTEGRWITEKPNFTDPKDLMTTQVDVLKEFSTSTCDTASTSTMPDWRLVNVGLDNYVFSDFPIPVDLSYNNANLLTAATNGFPVGDLNWFPAKKTQWLAQRSAEMAIIDKALNTGKTGVAHKPAGEVPVDFVLQQNYPNPFNPSTHIAYSVPKSGVVTLKVYDAMGREVATLVDGYKNAGITHHVVFDGSKLASGVYMYKLSDGSYEVTKKMMLVK
ncbi:MAG TPA: T9SS type A sorting domain-containing protein [bacterium]|nr:T9SS type A sorting domain-containing protein [bacterium]HQJ65277.1 T9SS type A sorting domain-containing protein [bacterium]